MFKIEFKIEGLVSHARKISKFEDFLTQLQQNITTALEQHETNAAKFISDKWQKPDTHDQNLKAMVTL